ncbi:hypothetical protein A9264_07250 [Vibrio sp. UCD-FRSSP16_10]|uniref:hypothetical protein n=1 Tax=unclassified Vibrio TaxID=2614977 RepID=UPI0007FC4AD4|nr:MULTISPECIES: hypothetical protein [unclassified Vibrio]OBT13454.1 hypothetical protein A9264_07250 [Vibrio sp. UCD-FRSSP16_10]OBT18016.1 hypothetical protein A9260_01240 [Vibrio sp. UCD-FRSSP16_30]
MHLYAQLSVQILLPMTIGALAILMIALLKGDICPGQRGRLHKQLPIITCLFFVCAGAMPAFVVPASLLIYFSMQTKSQTKKGKTRDSGPVLLLGLALFSATLFWLYAMISPILDNKLVSIFGLVLASLATLIFLGAALAHLLMIRARTRLQAFHTLLPVAGILSLMLLVLSVLIQAHWVWADDSSAVIEIITKAFPVLLMAIILWSWHLFRSSKVNLTQISLALLFGLVGSGLLLPLF